MSKTGQSVYDLCLQTYGNLELLTQLLQENKIVNTLEIVLAGKVIIFDKTKIRDVAVYSRNIVDNIIYATMYAPPYGTTEESIELREAGEFELREDGGFELR